MMNKQKTVLISGVLITAALITIFALNLISYNQAEDVSKLPERNYTVPQVEIMFNYGSKVVYTTDTTVNKDPYIDDCSTRGGTFNACGNTCAPSENVCASVCALTCNIK